MSMLLVVDPPGAESEPDVVSTGTVRSVLLVAAPPDTDAGAETLCAGSAGSAGVAGASDPGAGGAGAEALLAGSKGASDIGVEGGALFSGPAGRLEITVEAEALFAGPVETLDPGAGWEALVPGSPRSELLLGSPLGKSLFQTEAGMMYSLPTESVPRSVTPEDTVSVGAFVVVVLESGGYEKSSGVDRTVVLNLLNRSLDNVRGHTVVSSASVAVTTATLCRTGQFLSHGGQPSTVTLFVL
ncbi:hypothetical protein EJ08DRAFT_347269 [Tothia fuscella]|uniref:Uncharacterized protein n=1 Tax=Tothia fuscella TaxID=1048955 RepID=A0A9P4NMJ1_9PEZI|nr:hypothetical protein EJ08DRAFT_347269 [Tothia fuscella]